VRLGGENELKNCPFCGTPADLVAAVRERTYIAICRNRRCRASISIHYGKRHASLPLGTLKLKELVSPVTKENGFCDAGARRRVIQAWNERHAEQEQDDDDLFEYIDLTGWDEEADLDE
jgi:hypothetical protein